MGSSATNYTDNSLIQEGDYYYRLYAYYRDLDCTSAPANRHYHPNEFELHVYFSPTGVGEDESSVKVYPNPTKGLVNVEAEGMTSVELYNTLGQRVVRKDVAGNQTVLNLQDATQGLYLLRVTTEKGTISKPLSIEP